MSGERPERGERSLAGARLVAMALIALALLIVWQGFQISEVRGFSPVGPSTFPLAIGAIMLVLAGLLLVRTTLWADEDLAVRAAAEERATHWPTPLLLIGLLLVYALALDGFRLGDFRVPGLGYIISTAVFLPAAAWVLGSRAPLRDMAIGTAIAIVVYFAFTEYLGVELPAGVLDAVL